MGWFSGTAKCASGGCHRSIPSGNRYCGTHAQAGGVRRSGNGASTHTPKAAKVHPCGRRLRSGATCYRSVTGNESCGNSGH